MLAAALLALADARSDEPGALDAVVRPALKAAGIDPQVVAVADAYRCRLAAQTFEVADGPGFSTFDELIASVRACELDQAVVDSVAAVAERMAAAEHAVHGPAENHLHELAGLDTAVDLIAVAALIHMLAPDRVLASPPALGDGTIETAHGRLQVPAPAVLALLKGLPTAGAAPDESSEARAAGRAHHSHRRRPPRPVRGRLRPAACRPRRGRGLRRRQPRDSRAPQPAARRAHRRDASPGCGRRRGRLRRAPAPSSCSRPTSTTPRPRCWPMPPTCCARPAPWTCGSRTP